MNCQLKKGVFCVVLEPKKMQLIATVLKMLFEGHTGVVRVKQIAHNHVGWPCIDKDIETWLRLVLVQFIVVNKTTEP